MLFDDGDEIVIMNGNGDPVEIIVTDVTASFNDCEIPLTEFATDYLQPIYDRHEKIPESIDIFKDSYINEFIMEFNKIQANYRKNRMIFRNMFDEKNSSTEFTKK